MPAGALTTDSAFAVLSLTLSAAAYAVSPWLGRMGAVAAAAVLLVAAPRVALLGLVVVAGAAEVHVRRLAEQTRRLATAEAEKRKREREAAETARLSRSLAAVAGGLQGAFEPGRQLWRFTTLVRTLLGADAAVTLAAVDGREQFQILQASREGAVSLPETRDTVFPLVGIDGVGVHTLSFSAGDSGLFGALMREQLSSTIGFATPVLRGKQLAGLLVVGYGDAGRTLGETDRSFLAASAALGATLLESARLHLELRSSNEVKTEFISTVSHELRTPLNAIIGFCDLLRDGTMGEVNDDQRDALDRLMRHSVELAELIEGILEVDRLEGTYLSINWTKCDLDVFFRHVQSSVPAYWKKDGVELRWAGTASRAVLTDPEKLRLSLRNLVQNALKFTNEGSVVVEMSVTPGTLMFTVRDTGIGIKPEVREGLFRMFQQGDRVNTRTRGGLGLGLYLADRMIKALWGQISIDSVPGEGTTARIILPIEEPVAGEAAAETRNG